MRGHPSYTSLTLFEQCPAAFAAAYHRGEPAVVPQNVTDGKRRHKAWEVYALHCRDRKLTTDFDFGRRLAAGLGGSLEDEFAACVENWAWEWSTVKAAPIEGELSALLPDGVTRFTGHPDLVQQVEGSASAFGEGEDLWVVTDFKSHFHGWPEQPPTQLLWYAWLVQRNWPTAQDFSLVIAPLDGSPARQWTIGGSQVAAVGETLQGKVDLITAEDEFAPNVGNCAGCFYALACPHKATETMAQVRDIQRLAADGLWHNEQAKVRRNLVKAYCVENGPLPGRFEATTSTGLVPVNSATIETELQRFNVSANSLRGGFDKAKVLRAAKQIEKAGGGAEAFRALWQEKSAGTRWKWVSSADDDVLTSEGGED